MGSAIHPDERLAAQTLDEWGVAYRVDEEGRIVFIRAKSVPIHDDDLGVLYRLSHLKTVHLLNAPVTDYGVARLQRALPGCQILVEP